MRLLTSQDAEAFRALRLEALELNPESFGAHLEEEVSLPASEFERRIHPTDKVLAFGEFDEAGALVGFMGWFRERGVKTSHKSWLWGSYVRPHLRGRGVGAALLKAMLGRVRDVSGVRQVQLHVGAQNAPARRLYSKSGFIRVALLPESLVVEGRAIDEELWFLRVNEKVEP